MAGHHGGHCPRGWGRGRHRGRRLLLLCRRWSAVPAAAVRFLNEHGTLVFFPALGVGVHLMKSFRKWNRLILDIVFLFFFAGSLLAPVPRPWKQQETPRRSPLLHAHRSPSGPRCWWIGKGKVRIISHLVDNFLSLWRFPRWIERLLF